MPQKRTTVSLYMPNHDERKAIIINSIRQNTSKDMTDPSKRTFTTEHDKKIDLYPEEIKLQSKTTGTKVGLEDEDTIFIKSHKNIDIKAKEEILLKAPIIKIEAKEELNLIKGDALSGTVESSITQSTEIDKKAKTQTKATGTDKAAYPQIEDAPPEEKFDGAKVFANVVAGLAVVGLVTIATAAIVVATGGSAAIIAGAALGGTISVGMTALFDKINNRVSSISEYMFNGFTGAVTGAISGGIDNAKRLGKGAKLLSEAVSGFIIGTGEDAARQVVLEGKELREVDGTRSVMNGIMNAGLAIAVPLIIKGGQAVVNKIKTQGVNTAVEEVVEKAVKETSEEVTEEVAEKGAKSLANNSDEMISKGLSNTKTKYAYNMIENPGPLAEVRGNPASNFISGKYNIETLDEDIILYRSGKEGGLTIPGKEQNALGQWFTREPAESVAKVRIDSAVKAQWIDPKTGVLTGTSTIESTYAIKIPKGTIIYEGPVGYQGGIYLGGENCNQIFVSEPWKIHDVKPLSETPIK